MTAAKSLPPLTRGRRIELIVILGALTAAAPISIDMYLPALPTIAHAFGDPIGEVERTLASFFLGFALGQALFGPLADRFGKVRVSVVAMTAFSVSARNAMMTAPAADAIASPARSTACSEQASGSANAAWCGGRSELTLWTSALVE